MGNSLFENCCKLIVHHHIKRRMVSILRVPDWHSLSSVCEHNAHMCIETRIQRWYDKTNKLHPKGEIWINGFFYAETKASIFISLEIRWHLCHYFCFISVSSGKCWKRNEMYHVIYGFECRFSFHMPWKLVQLSRVRIFFRHGKRHIKNVCNIYKHYKYLSRTQIFVGIFETSKTYAPHGIMDDIKLDSVHALCSMHIAHACGTEIGIGNLLHATINFVVTSLFPQLKATLCS